MPALRGSDSCSVRTQAARDSLFGAQQSASPPCAFAAALALIVQPLDAWQQLRGSFLELCLAAGSKRLVTPAGEASSSTQVSHLIVISHGP